MAPTPNPTNATAYINGRVYTIDKNQPWAEAFMISVYGEFTAVGPSEDIKRHAEEEGLVVHDLENQFVMPGLHDAHTHMLMAGIASMAQISLPIRGLTSENVVEELKKGSCLCKHAHFNEDWVSGTGYLVEGFHRSALDKEWGDTPVYIRGGAGHSAFFNTEALKRTGYDIEAEPEAQGAMFMRDEHGHLTGEMAENGLNKAYTKVPHPDAEGVKSILREAQYKLHRAGITSCQEASANTRMMEGLQELENEGALKLEMFTHLVYGPEWVGEESTSSLRTLLDSADEYTSAHVNTRFVKIILDGVPLEPYYTQAGLLEDGTVDESKLLVLDVKEAVQKYDDLGVTMKIHCTGHGATRLALDVFEAVRKDNPDGPRHEVAHCSGVHDDDYKRFKELNVTAEMSPAFFFVHPITEASGGLMDWNFPKMLAAGAHLTIGSDWGAGEMPDLLPFLGGLVDGVGGGDRALGGQRLCRMLTLGGAEAVGREVDLGSIEVGKKANFIVVDKDLSKGDFEGSSVLKTWFEGELVYVKSS